MTPGGHGIGRRKDYEDIGPQRWRCGIAAWFVLLSAFVSSDLHAAVPTPCAHRLQARLRC